jgi:dipeptidyl aminopeptidase/acylaminoacyl peptidase
MAHVRRSVALLSIIAAPLLAQQQNGPSATTAPRERGPIPPAEYGKWESLGSGALSPDGKWVTYDIRRVSGSGELHYRLVAAEPEHTVRQGSGGTFSSNNRWLIYNIIPDTTGGGRAGRGGGGGGGAGRGGTPAPAANHAKVGIVDLRAGTTTVLDDIQSFMLSKTGTHVALRRYPPAGRQGRGADLVVRDLEQATDITLGNVADFAWNDDGTLLAVTIDVEGKTGNGVTVLNAATGAIRSLDAGDASYTTVQWRAHSDDLVSLRSRIDSTFADTGYTVLAWRGVGTPRLTKQTYDFTADATFPKGMRVAPYRRPLWADDGSIVFVGIATHEPKPPATDRRATAAEQPARVEIWHWKDLREYHQQDRQGAQDRQRTHLSAWHLATNKLVPLADDSTENVQLSDNRKTALAWDERPYFKEVISGRQYRDIYRIDVATGQRKKIISKTVYNPNLSPDGRYVLYTRDGQWWSHDLTTDAEANLTGKTGATFVNAEDDHPIHERRPYGVGGWITGGKSAIVYDRFDLWRVNADGSGATRLTRGGEDSTVYRVVTLDAEERWLNPAKPLTLSATGDYTRKSGYARLTLGQPAQRALWLDKGVSQIEKAKSSNVYLFTEQSYSDSPNYFVSSAAFTDAKQVSHTNPFQSDYAWGKQVLLPYTNGHGDKLQMMLTYPADYQPGKKYPMVVYYYEKLSQGFHQYIAPSERATYSTTVFSQNGYFVLRPDILFRAREAGFSGLDCVTSAVKTVLATGMIDPARVGNMGHSWGGYQSAFYAVHGHGIFAATIAGAPLTDFISMYGYTSFNTGSPETGHFETGQERMQVSLWEDPQAYIRNSTVFAVDSLQTPLLLEEGDADGNVNYWQAMELYNFGRRLGKNVVFLIYNDENHGVARPESQIDYARRQLQWSAHYLKGEPAADWITNGETYLARQKLLKEASASSATVAGTPQQATPVGGRGGRNP